MISNFRIPAQPYADLRISLSFGNGSLSVSADGCADSVFGLFFGDSSPSCHYAASLPGSFLSGGQSIRLDGGKSGFSESSATLFRVVSDPEVPVAYGFDPVRAADVHCSVFCDVLKAAAAPLRIPAPVSLERIARLAASLACSRACGSASTVSVRIAGDGFYAAKPRIAAREVYIL